MVNSPTDYFIGRKSELNDIFQNIEIYRFDKIRHTFYLGLPKTGKTTLLLKVFEKLKKDPKIIPLYLDFEKIVTTPEDFGRRFLEETLFQVAARKTIKELPALKIGLNIESLKKNQSFIPYFKDFDKKTREEKLKRLLSIPNDFLKKQKEKYKPYYLIDNLSEVFHLSSYRGINDVGKILLESFLSEDVSSILTITFDKWTDKLLDQKSFPILNIEVKELGPLERNEVLGFYNKKLKNIDLETRENIAKLSLGHPFYVTSLLEIFKNEKRINEKKANQIFDKALLETSAISIFLLGYYQNVLLKARYYGPLKQLMKYLSKNEGLTQIEICRGVKEKQGMVRLYLNELEMLGVIFRENKKYFFADNVLKRWISKTR